MLLAFKIVFVPLVIALVTLAGRMWGAQVSGFLAGLPVIAGPILVFICLDQGVVFAAASAEASLMGVASLGLFCVGYAWASMCVGVAFSLVAGLFAFGAGTAISVALDPSPVVALCVVVVALGVMARMLPPDGDPLRPSSSTAQEIGCRMLAAVLLVLSITTCAEEMGPRLSGLLAPFPVAGTVLAGFTHTNSGAASARRLLRGFLGGLFGMAAFMFVMTAGLSSFGLPLTVFIGVVSALCVGNGVALLRRRALRFSSSGLTFKT